MESMEKYLNDYHRRKLYDKHFSIENNIFKNYLKTQIMCSQKHFTEKNLHAKNFCLGLQRSPIIETNKVEAFKLYR